MTKSLKALMFVAGLPATVGCLNQDVTETWYLEPDGTVT